MREVRVRWALLSRSDLHLLRAGQEAERQLWRLEQGGCRPSLRLDEGGRVIGSHLVIGLGGGQRCVGSAGHHSHNRSQHQETLRTDSTSLRLD